MYDTYTADPLPALHIFSFEKKNGYFKISHNECYQNDWHQKNWSSYFKFYRVGSFQSPKFFTIAKVRAWIASRVIKDNIRLREYVCFNAAESGAIYEKWVSTARWKQKLLTNIEFTLEWRCFWSVHMQYSQYIMLLIGVMYAQSKPFIWSSLVHFFILINKQRDVF